MSAIDYSRFDRIGDSDDEAPEEKGSAAAAAEGEQRPPGGSPAALPEPRLVGTVAEKGSEDGRYKYVHQGREIYEWEQSLEEVNIYIRPPPGVTAKHIACSIGANHMTLGIRGNPPFLDEDTGGLVRSDESYWMMNEDGELVVNLQKGFRGETWDCALQGRGGQAVDPATRQEIQKKMMLERFQAENPGFDFSNAEFNGAAPDPRTFMDGIRHA